MRDVWKLEEALATVEADYDLVLIDCAPSLNALTRTAWAASDRVVVIGDRCLIGRNSGIVGHFSVEIGNDVWTGHHVYVTDQNHGYEDPTRPISLQTQPERAVRIGDGSWIGHGAVILPGVTIGRHVVVGANSVVTSDIPDFSVAVGSPARVIRQLRDGKWEDARQA